MQTSWGSRADGDADDGQRLALAPEPAVVLKTPPGTTSLIRFYVRHQERQALSSDESSSAWEKHAVTASDCSRPTMAMHSPVTLLTDHLDQD